jgi:hypothetical protein
MATVEGTVPIKEPVKHNEKLIITASSLGTVFECTISICTDC